MYFNDLAYIDRLISFEKGLNPYCNGCTSMINKSEIYRLKYAESLNPYCNGCTSMMGRIGSSSTHQNCLNPYCNACTSMIMIHRSGNSGIIVSQSLL